MSARAYSCTVTSRAHLVIGIVIAALAAAVVVALGAPLVALGTAVVCVATAVFVSTVRLVVGNGRVVLGQGPFACPSRTIPTADVVSATAVHLSWAQVFGIGVPFHFRTTRLTVRPGPTLCLTLASGEEVRVSTRDPAQAIAVLAATTDDPSPRPRR